MIIFPNDQQWSRAVDPETPAAAGSALPADGLCGIVRSQMAFNAFGGSVDIFMNRRRTHVKLLLWEGDGFSIYYKRLEKGTYELPTGSGSFASVAMDARQFL